MGTITVGMHEAKTHFSRLVRQAQDGADVVVENNGTPVARIVPYVAEEPRRRTGGFGKGLYSESPDCWGPDPELEALFYEGDLQ